MTDRDRLRAIALKCIAGRWDAQGMDTILACPYTPQRYADAARILCQMRQQLADRQHLSAGQRQYADRAGRCGNRGPGIPLPSRIGGAPIMRGEDIGRVIRNAALWTTVMDDVLDLEGGENHE